MVRHRPSEIDWNKPHIKFQNCYCKPWFIYSKFQSLYNILRGINDGHFFLKERNKHLWILVDSWPIKRYKKNIVYMYKRWETDENPRSFKLNPWLPTECPAKTDQTAWMRRLIWVFARSMCNLEGNAVSCDYYKTCFFARILFSRFSWERTFRENKMPRKGRLKFARNVG